MKTWVEVWSGGKEVSRRRWNMIIGRKNTTFKERLSVMRLRDILHALMGIFYPVIYLFGILAALSYLCLEFLVEVMDSYLKVAWTPKIFRWFFTGKPVGKAD